MEGIAFDPVGNLWGSHRAGAAGAPGLYRIDVATGAATFVAPFLDASGSSPSGGVVSLQFACDGTLYGGTAFPVPPGSGGDLIKILTAGTPGFFSTIGKAVPDASLGALAFQNACEIPIVPSVSEWGMILLALLFVAQLAWMRRRRRVV